MRIAISLVHDKLSPHFGHCDQFAVVEVDGDTNKITSRKNLTPPAHEPGVLPAWLGGMGVNVVIAGGMGQRAQQLFTQNQIEVMVGAPDQNPEDLVIAYLGGKLQCGENVCDH